MEPAHSHVKTASNARPPSQDEFAAFFSKLSQCQSKPAILSIIPHYSDSYVPKTSESFPLVLINLLDEDCYLMDLDQLRSHCEKITIDGTTDQAKQVEVETREQSSCKLWF